MKKLGIALALVAFSCVLQAQTVVKWDGQSDSMTGLSSASGTWTIGIELNKEALLSFGQGGSRQQPTNGDYSNTGNALFTVNGTGTYKLGDTDRTGEVNQSMTTTLGWGGNWYYDLEQRLEGSSLTKNMDLVTNGVGEGLQLGVAATPNAAKDLSGAGVGEVLGNVNWFKFFAGIFNGTAMDELNEGLSKQVFGVYCADMKVQNSDNANDWTINESNNASTPNTLSDITKLASISVADLYIVHTYAGGDNNTDRDYANNGSEGDWMTQETFTTFYLTIEGKDAQGNDVSIRYMGQNNDVSGQNAPEGSFLGGSAYYDVDNVGSITGINSEFIDNMIFIGEALDAAQRSETNIPEPTTATLSLLALAALAAHRRRR